MSLAAINYYQYFTSAKCVRGFQMQHSAIPAQAVIDLAHENQGDKFVFGVSWKHMN